MSKEPGYYFFSLRGKYFLYDFLKNIIFEVNETLYSALSKYANGEKGNSNELELIEDFLNAGLLQDFNGNFESDSCKDEIAYLSFAPTYKCNFRCSYCFGEYGEKYIGEKREFTEESLNKMLDHFFNKAFPQAKQYRIDFVSGGEPLLGWDIIKQAMVYFEKHSERTKKPVSVWLCTNASLITDDIIEYLSLHNVSIGISIDGRKEYNDINRIDCNGRGTYDKICEGIALIKRNEKVSKKFKNIWGLCTATNDNCDFVDILNHMKNLGFPNVQIRLIRSEKKYNVEKLLSQYERLACTLFEMFLNEDLTFFRMILNDNDQFGKVLKRVILDHFLLRRCNAGVNKITICPDGTIYPCDSLVGISDCVIGDSRGFNKHKKIYDSVTLKSIPKCSSCDVKYLCGGDCYYNSLLKTGNMFISDDEYCQLQRAIINESIALRYKMQTTNEELYYALFKEVKRKYDYSELFG